MASTIITKNSSTASAVPVVGDLTKGELAVNVTDKKIYTKDNSAAVVKLVGSLGNQEANAVAITGGSIAGITDLAVADGGTGASTASDARTNLGLGTIATQAASSVTITGGSVTGITDITVADGGTGASTASNARTNLGAAASGANSDITSLSGLTTALSVAQGGTGITSFGSGVATFLGTPSSANLLAAVTDETGTGALVFANTPTLVAPILGTPTSGNFTTGSFTWPTFNQNTTGTAAGLSATLAIASGGTGATTAGGALTSLGAYAASNPSGYTTNTGTVTSVGGTGTVNGISLSGTVTTSGNLTLGGTLSGVSLTSQVSGTLPTANGGTNLTSFTSGGVVYASSTSALATGSDLTFSSGKLAVGNFQFYRDAANGNCFIFDTTTAPYSGPIIFGVNNAEALRLTSTSLYTASGINVGIGTSSPNIAGWGASTRVLTILGSSNLGYGGTIELSNTSTSAADGDILGQVVAADSAASSNPVARMVFNRAGTTTANRGGSITFATKPDNGTITDRLTISSSGNLGLGVTPSAWDAAFKAFQFNTTGCISATSNRTFVGQNWYDAASGGKHLANGFALRYDQIGANGSHAWYTSTSGTAGNAISFSQAMTLDASGNLGVGTTSPVGRVDIQQSTTDMVGLSILNTNGAVGTTTSSQVRLGITNSAGVSYAVIKAQEASADDYPALTFAVQNAVTTTPTERARIDSSGNLLVGTTSTSNGALINWYKASGTIETSLGGITTAQNHIVFANPNGNVGSIQVDGSATSYNTSSDYRLKNTIAPMTGALAKVALLKPCTYKWNTDNSDGEGFIAHELAEVVPQCVTGEKDAVDEDGNPVYQGIDTSFLVATLTAAIQELKAEFDAYKASHP